MNVEFSFEGRSCWSAYGPGEFFGFTKQGDTIFAVVRVENDHSVRLLDISKGDFRLSDMNQYPQIDSATIQTEEGSNDIYLKVCNFRREDGWVCIVYVDNDGDICEKQYREDSILSVDLIYKQQGEQTP